MAGLKKFEGREVRGVEIAITHPGNALSKSMAIEPVEHHTGDTVYVVLECKVGQITHKPIPDTDAYQRVEQYKAALATLVVGDLVKEVLDAQRDVIRQADEEAKGILSFGEGDEPEPRADDWGDDGK